VSGSGVYPTLPEGNLNCAGCTVCGKTFASVRSFDKHRNNGKCTLTGTGLVQSGVMWYDEQDIKLKERMEAMRK